MDSHKRSSSGLLGIRWCGGVLELAHQGSACLRDLRREKKSRPGLFLPACMFLWASVYRREGERLFTRAQMPSTGRKVFQMSVEMPKQNARNPLFPLLDEAPRN